MNSDSLTDGNRPVKGPTVEVPGSTDTMAQQIAAFDWSGTPLGPMGEWPESLRAAVQLLLNSRFPMFVWWGPELINLYNDAYVPILGKKHGNALGRPAAEVWYEIWDVVGPQASIVLNEQKATWNEEVLLVMERYGYIEETYFTWSYSPVVGADGTTAGLFCACKEDTASVVGRRRLKTLRELAAETADLRTAPEAFATATSVLSRNLHDIPFALIYEFDKSSSRARLAGSVGVQTSELAIPVEIEVEEHGNPWHLNLLSNDVQSVSHLERFFDVVPAGAWPHPPTEAMILPLGMRGDAQPGGVVIAGVSRYARLDEDYRGFLSLVAGHIATAVANVRAYESERQRAESLAELDRAKTLFFSNVSHEFRTPLTLMLGPLEDLLARAGSADERSQIEVIHRNGLRLLKLVNTLLDFSRIEAGRTQADLETVDLASYTAELASSFHSAMDKAGLAYQIDCAPLSRSAQVDREMWEKIVLNLISNAFKYTLKGSVSVQLREINGFAELSVTDSGIGIPQQDLVQIFERFHRVEGARGRTHEGTGIGLALVYELVKLHDGKVSVVSEVDQGSTFTVRIPVAQSRTVLRRGDKTRRSTALHADAFVEEALRWLPSPEAESPQTSPNASAYAPPSEGMPELGIRSHILVADDNTDMRNYLTRLLGERYRVTAARNGEEALSAAIADPPDLVLTDVMMPVMDGFQLISAFRTRPGLNMIPLIVLSARSGEESLIEGLDAGADDYLMKPFTARELLARVSAHLALRKERQRAHERLIQIFQQAPVAIVVLQGPDYMVELANPTYQALLEGRDVIGRKFADVMPEIGGEVWNAFRHVMSTGQPFIANDFYVPYDFDRDGALEDHWFNVNYQPLKNPDGSTSGIIAVLTEVTRQVLARKELERANAELEEFAYVASHDLQEPLRMVNIYTQLLLKRPGFPTDEQSTQFAEYVHTGVSRMERLIRDLLLYSRTVHPEQEAARLADLNRSLDEALSVLRMRIEEKHAVVTHDPMPVVWADESQLALVFQNLVSNSLKYCAPGITPQIHISAEQSGESQYLIHVRDNGLGFEPRHAERIFGLFKRLHKDEYPGTGLGLAICRRVVERYGGKIWAESEGDGRGATMHIALRTHPQ